ncbi:MAG TPA: TlpA disulfide reductase family protein [Sphingomicrobium sp.]|nr:TlpA disulfide reductase family protein [Sphingomicrobium sp.]
MAMRRNLLVLALGALLASCDSGGGSAGDAPVTKGVERRSAGKMAPDVELRDADDQPAILADARGKPLLVNLWASWCAPCVKELPTLEALSRRPGAPRVIAVSQDMAPRASVDAFTERLKLDELETWHDPKMALSGALDAQVLPVTILYDAGGRELWRYVGDLDWNGPEAARLLAEARAPQG